MSERSNPSRASCEAMRLLELHVDAGDRLEVERARRWVIWSSWAMSEEPRRRRARTRSGGRRCGRRRGPRRIPRHACRRCHRTRRARSAGSIRAARSSCGAGRRTGCSRACTSTQPRGGVQTKRLGDLLREGAARFDVQLSPAAEEVSRIEVAEHGVDVGDGRLLAVVVIADGARVRACAPRPDPRRPRARVDRDDAAARESPSETTSIFGSA